MSRTYRIPLGIEQLQLHGNAIALPINLVHILPPEDMQELLKQELTAAGWQQEERGWVHKLNEEMSAVIDPDLSNLQVHSNQQTLRVEDISLPQEVRSKIASGQEVSVQELGSHGLSEGKTAAGIARARQALNTVLGKVYKEAVVQRAGELGSVESIQETESEQGVRTRIIVQG